MTNIKIHIIYWILITLIIIIWSFESILAWFLGINQEGYLRLTTDVELYNPKNGELVGYLKKGIVLKYPHIDDLDDTDLGDNDRFKIYVDLKGVERKYRTYVDSLEEAFDERNSSVYNSLILKPAKNKSSQNKEETN